MAHLARPQDLVFAFLRTDAGSSDMVVDGSSTPVLFKYTAVGKTILSRVNISILDGTPITAVTFGGQTALTNGITFEIRRPDGSLLKNFMPGHPIVKNADFGLLAGVDWTQAIAAGLGAVTVRWSMFKSGKEVVLEEGETFECLVQDEITVDGLMIMVQGYMET